MRREARRARSVSGIRHDPPGVEDRRMMGPRRGPMAFRVAGRHLDEIVVLEPQVYQDDRGSFMEAFRADQYRDLGLPEQFPQENHSISCRGVVRGLHFQWTPPMGKVMRVTAGAAFLVAVDIR